ncbi:MAG: cell division protein FtsX [Rhodospirillales bacterium]|jgi:cell division transport system permease protein
MFTRQTDLALAQDNHSRFLPWLIAFMVYLAILAMAGTFILNGLVVTWDRNMSGTMTVQLPSADNPKQNKRNIDKALKILRVSPGISNARVATAKEMMGLLEPWLGSSSSLSELPLPQLIDVTLVPGDDVNVKAIAKRLDAAVPHASIDDHRVWLDRFLRLIRTVQAIAISILALICLATVGTVIFTTRTGLAVHQEAIEVLHLIGAQDTYIARQFSTRAMMLALRGGFIGLALAIPTLIAIGTLSAAMDAGAIPKLSMGFDEWFVIGVMPLATAILAMVTARFTVLKSLAQML